MASTQLEQDVTEAKLDPVHLFGFYDLIPEPASSNLTPKKNVFFWFIFIPCICVGPVKNWPPPTWLPQINDDESAAPLLALLIFTHRTVQLRLQGRLFSRLALGLHGKNQVNGEWRIWSAYFFIEPSIRNNRPRIPTLIRKLLLKPISVLIFLFLDKFTLSRLLSKKTIPSHWFPLNLRTSNKNHPYPAEKSKTSPRSPPNLMACQPISHPVAPRNKAHLRVY